MLCAVVMGILCTVVNGYPVRFCMLLFASGAHTGAKAMDCRHIQTDYSYFAPVEIGFMYSVSKRPRAVARLGSYCREPVVLTVGLQIDLGYISIHACFTRSKTDLYKVMGNN